MKRLIIDTDPGVDDAHAILRVNDHKERIWVEQVTQFMRQRGNFLVHFAGIPTGDHDAVTVDLMVLRVFKQFFI